MIRPVSSKMALDIRAPPSRSSAPGLLVRPTTPQPVERLGHEVGDLVPGSPARVLVPPPDFRGDAEIRGALEPRRLGDRNALLALVARYPELERCYEEASKAYDRLIAEQPIEFHAAYIANLEATFTPLFKVILDNRDSLFTGGDQRVASLMMWHFVEEIEHRSSGLILCRHVNPDPWYRVKHIRAHVPPCRLGLRGDREDLRRRRSARGSWPLGGGHCCPADSSPASSRAACLDLAAVGKPIPGLPRGGSKIKQMFMTWLPMTMTRQDGSTYSLFVMYQEERGDGFLEIRCQAEQQNDDGSSHRFVSVEQDMHFQDDNRRFTHGTVTLIDSDGAKRPLTITAAGPGGFHLGTAGYYGWNDWVYGQWVGDLKVEGNHSSTATSPRRPATSSAPRSAGARGGPRRGWSRAGQRRDVRTRRVSRARADRGELVFVIG